MAHTPGSSAADVKEKLSLSPRLLRFSSEQSAGRRAQCQEASTKCQALSLERDKQFYHSGFQRSPLPIKETESIARWWIFLNFRLSTAEKPVWLNSDRPCLTQGLRGIKHGLVQWLSTRGNFATLPTMSGSILGDATRLQWGEVRDAAQHPTMPRAAPTTDSSPA